MVHTVAIMLQSSTFLFLYNLHINVTLYCFSCVGNQDCSITVELEWLFCYNIG